MLYLKSASSNLFTCKVSSKNKKTLNLGPKIPYLGIFVLQFNKSYYEVFNQNLWNYRVSSKAKRKKNLHLKILYLGLWAGLLKKYVHIWNQCPPICLISNFLVKMTMLKLGTKNALFGYFCAAFWNQYCHIWNLPKICQKNCHIWYQRTPICLAAKLAANIKSLNLRPKVPDLGILGLEVDNNTAIFEISTLEFVSFQNFPKK